MAPRWQSRQPEVPPLTPRSLLLLLLQCLQYKTDQQADLKKIERFNTLLVSLMATGEDPPGALADPWEALHARVPPPYPPPHCLVPLPLQATLR